MVKVSLHILLFLLFFLAPTHTWAMDNGLEWARPWAEVRPQALERCADHFEELQLQEVCLENEKRGHVSLQGDYGLPPEKASKAKERCAGHFDELQLQDICMQNEAEAYRRLYGK